VKYVTTPSPLLKRKFDLYQKEHSHLRKIQVLTIVKIDFADPLFIGARFPVKSRLFFVSIMFDPSESCDRSSVPELFSRPDRYEITQEHFLTAYKPSFLCPKKDPDVDPLFIGVEILSTSSIPIVQT